MKYLNTIILGAFIILLGLFFAMVTVKSTSKYDFKLAASEMLKKVVEENQFISLDQAKKFSSEKTKGIRFVDIRSPDEFVTYHLPGAINIPYERLLDEEFRSFFENEDKKILHGKNVSHANASWMLLTQYGYKNFSVLEGSVQDWKLYVDNKDIFKGKFTGPEKAAYDYKKIMEETGN